jgi:hypothetical protein
LFGSPFALSDSLLLSPFAIVIEGPFPHRFKQAQRFPFDPRGLTAVLFPKAVGADQTMSIQRTIAHRALAAPVANGFVVTTLECREIRLLWTGHHFSNLPTIAPNLEIAKSPFSE